MRILFMHTHAMIIGHYCLWAMGQPKLHPMKLEPRDKNHHHIGQ